MPSTNLRRIASKIGSWTMLSRIAGYGRDMLMAQVLGASAIAEAFQIAFTFPNLFRSLFGEGAMNAALIPHFSALHTSKGNIAARQFLGDVLLLVAGLMLTFTGLAYVFMPEIVGLLAWGFEDAAKIQLTIDLAQVCLPYLFCIIVAAILGGILNHAGRFSVPAAAPILLNVMMIAPLAYVVMTGDAFSIFSLAYAVAIGGVVQLLLCLVVAYKIRCMPIFRHRLMNKELRTFGLLFLPGVISALCLQGNLIVSRAFASTLEEGSIIWLFFAERLFQLPLAIIGISLAVALLPTLSRAISAGDHQRANILQRQTQQAALLLAIPAAAGLMLCAELIIDVLFARGAFTATDTMQSARALQALALGLPAYILVKILQPLFFAHRNTKTPMLIAFVMMVVNIVFAGILMQFFAHAGLALATAIAGWVQVLLLLVALKRRKMQGMPMDVVKFALRVCLATLCMAAIVYGLQMLQQNYMPDLHAGIFLAMVMAVAGISYLVAATILTGYKWRGIFQKHNK